MGVLAMYEYCSTQSVMQVNRRRLRRQRNGDRQTWISATVDRLSMSVLCFEYNYSIRDRNICKKLLRTRVKN